MKKSILAVISFFVAGCGGVAEVNSPWDLDMLFEAPEWESSEVAEKPGLKGILYDSLSYEGKRVQVFAYYGVPEGTAPIVGWPAVVCVHGGGGTAFDSWVKLWNEHGYAAISMDLEGHYPVKKASDGSGPRMSTENPGPSRVGVFGDFAKRLDEQWYYHAVSQVILAHSLIRTFPDVNENKIGITGISWGGTLTSTTMGVDSRFKFAIPVYGCGFLPDSDGNQGDAIKPGMQTETVYKYFDGSAYFGNVRIPTLWVNGTNDRHFPLPSTQASSRAVRGSPTLRYELEMKHGHGPGWQPKEIYAFADSVVRGGKPLVEFEKPKVLKGVVSVGYRSSVPIRKAKLLYTFNTGVWNQRKWEESAASIMNSKIEANIPKGATTIFLSATDERDLMVSSEFIELK